MAMEPATQHHAHAFLATLPGPVGSVRRHYHAFHEIIAFTGGSGQQYFEADAHPFMGGDLFFLPARSWHIAGYDRRPCQAIVLNFYDTSFSDIHPGDHEARLIVAAACRRAYAAGPRLDLTPANRREVLRRLKAMVAAGARRLEIGRQCAIKSDLFAILGTLATDSRWGLTDEIHGRTDPESERIGRLTTYIGQHLAEDLSTPRLCAIVGLSPSHLHAVFKRQAGVTLVQYITRVRVQKAAELLSTTTLPLKEVAPRCGFPCLSHFYSVFRKHTGMPPGAFAVRAIRAD
jgi:AraC-like DNA-binding protein